MKIAVFWGGAHTLPGACDRNTWYSFYNSGWKYGFEQLGHTIDYFAWEDNGDHPGYDFYLYAPGFLTTDTFHKNLHHPNAFFTEEASLGISWAINHSFHYDAITFLDFLNWKSMKANGVKNAYWVPGAVDPTIFHPIGAERSRSATFLGNYDTKVVIHDGLTRIDYIRAIDSRVKDAVVARGYYADLANTVWNCTKLGVDVPIVDFCSFRLFQIIAAGAFCVTRKPRVPTGIDYLLPQAHCYYGLYNDLEDLIDNCIPACLNLIEVYPQAIEQTRKYVLENNTFKQRADQLLQIAGLKPVEEKLFYLKENYEEAIQKSPI